MSDLVERPLIFEISSTVFMGNINVVYYFEGQIEKKEFESESVLSHKCTHLRLDVSVISV